MKGRLPHERTDAAPDFVSRPVLVSDPMKQDDPSELSLDRLRILIVDDDPQCLSMLSLALRSMGNPKIQTFGDPAAAITFMKDTPSDALESGVTDIDIIISDYVMPEVDGGMFLRWVRLNEKSPDPFVCFIMMSGAADPALIQDARHIGMTEFLPKPFSIETVREKVFYAIQHPRDFYLAPGYFGPDRRREVLVDDFTKRGAKPQIIEVIRPDRGPVAVPDDTNVLHFKHPNRLLEKVRSPSSPAIPFIPLELAPEIRRRIDGVQGTFPAWASRQVGRLKTCNARLTNGGGDVKKILTQIRGIASHLAGPGECFDYPLLGEIGKSLKAAANPRDATVDKDRLKTMGDQIEGLAQVLRDRITDTESAAAQVVRKHVFGSNARAA